MKFAVLGATGPTGLQLIDQALERGHDVRAVVRNPSKITTKHERLQVVEANLMSSESLAPALDGCDMVLSALGAKNIISRCTLYSETAKAIAGAMQASNVKRLIAVTSWCTKPEPGNPRIMEWLIKPLFIGRMVADMGRMEEFLYKECPDVHFTSVRPPSLTNGPITDKPIRTTEGQWVAERPAYAISRADVARFILDIAQNGEWEGKAVAISV